MSLKQKQCPKCNKSFYTEYMSNPISICVEDNWCRRGWLFHKHECRLCGIQWHLVNIPKNHPVQVDKDGRYIINHPDYDLDWESVVVFEGVIPGTIPYVPPVRPKKQQRSMCVIS